MPPLIRFMIRHFVIGVCLGLLIVAFMIWKDMFSLRQLIESTQNFPLLAMFSFLMAITIGTVQMSVAVMTAEDPGRDIEVVHVPGPEEVLRSAETQARRMPDQD
ncbi:MAG: hypothetical protein ACI95S_001232 [Dinoroseobacter sp.]|jgi:hypothetical protein